MYENKEYINYLKKHKYCPNCGNDKNVQTMKAVDYKNGQFYNDNKVQCIKCKWIGIVDNLLSYEEVLNKENKQ